MNNTVACASCHNQAVGFSDTPAFSEGFEGGLTTAHSMRLV
ncbi:MAG TPA: cytochrome-c peroxidase, partial [Bacteroidetes bacterium]|nr:cytochrome-c peroxidase [Bacteroidota bacterium]